MEEFLGKLKKNPILFITDKIWDINSFNFGPFLQYITLGTMPEYTSPKEKLKKIYDDTLDWRSKFCVNVKHAYGKNMLKVAK